MGNDENNALTRREILQLIEIMTTEELVMFRDEILARLHNREAAKDRLAEAHPEG
jgi:hypothetical protein